MNAQCDIGLVGLAVMGQNLVLNIADHGFFGLTNNDRVTYEVKEMQNGPQAVRVKVIS